MKLKIALLFSVIYTFCLGGSYDIADDFLDNKLYDDAKRETIQIMYSGKEELKPEGYFILGKIDAVKGDLESARRNWIKLREYYPKSEFVKSAAERAAFYNISLNKETQKDIFEVYSIKMGMDEKSFQDAREDMKARLNKAGISVVRIKGEFLAGELFKIEMYFENFISFDAMKSIGAVSKIEALRSYIESRVNPANYSVVSSKSNDGRICNITLVDKKIYSKRYLPELEKNIELLRKMEKEKITPVKAVVDEEVLKQIEEEERRAAEEAATQY